MLAFASPVPHAAIAGGTFALLGEILRFWGVAYAGSLTRVTGSVGAPTVIMSGPFAIVRNPLYVGNMMLYVGIGIASNALSPWLAIGTAVYFVFQYSLIVSLEEEFLEKEFGAGYLEYKKHVPRFIPRVIPYEASAQEGQKPNWKEAIYSERRTWQAIVLVSVALWARSMAW